MRTLALTTSVRGWTTQARDQPPGRSPTLTPDRGTCHEVGNTAKTECQDAQTPACRIWKPRRLMRQFIANNPIPGEWGVWLYTSILGNLRWVYDNPSTPAQAEFGLRPKLACLRIAEHNGLSGTTVVKDRY